MTGPKHQYSEAPDPVGGRNWLPNTVELTPLNAGQARLLPEDERLDGCSVGLLERMPLLAVRMPLLAIQLPLLAVYLTGEEGVEVARGAACRLPRPQPRHGGASNRVPPHR